MFFSNNAVFTGTIYDPFEASIAVKDNTIIATDSEQVKPYISNTTTPPKNVKMWIIEAGKEDFRIRLHVCGNGAVRPALDCFEVAQDEIGKGVSRHTIEHIELIQPDELSRFAKLGVIASIQPEHVYGSGLEKT